ncbi:unnamed protein product, partial [marine sediment metagenome]
LQPCSISSQVAWYPDSRLPVGYNFSLPSDPVFKESAVKLSITKVGGIVNAANAVATKEATFIEFLNKSAISS